ncbi:MAG: Hydrogenase transcriptional regulatory protein hupR1 [Deltaproteobacteria bacterium ADurb.Bin510]|nr:MAG: Hydrogenase transcriptional regulatory protein hupR1 [Deltaproteobacteria bacterium ADurb.Bin510]
MSIRVMIIDDEAAICVSLGAYLEDQDFEVASFESAEAALAVLAHERFDAAIVDLRLPGIDGETFILKAHELWPAMNFLIHTGSMVYEPCPAVRAIGLDHADIYHKPLADLRVIAEAIIKKSGGKP